MISSPTRSTSLLQTHLPLLERAECGPLSRPLHFLCLLPERLPPPPEAQSGLRQPVSSPPGHPASTLASSPQQRSGNTCCVKECRNPDFVGRCPAEDPHARFGHTVPTRSLPTFAVNLEESQGNTLCSCQSLEALCQHSFSVRTLRGILWEQPRQTCLRNSQKRSPSGWRQEFHGFGGARHFPAAF